MTRALVILLVATAASAAPEPPPLRVLLQKDGQVTLTPKLRVGEPLTMTITVTPRPGTTLSLPAAFEITPFEVVARREVPAGPGERAFQLVIVAWEAGDLKLPPIPISYSIGGDAGEVKTDELPIKVEATILDQNAQPRPIAGPVAISIRDLTLAWIGVGALGGIGLVLGAMALWRRRRARWSAARGAADALDTRTPEEIALAHLRELAERGLGGNDPRPFYFRLTEIVRDYLGRRFGFDALELTSEELLGRMGTTPIRTDLARWLFTCDLVKYARAPSDAEEAHRELDQARTIVERCRPAPPEVRVVA